MAATLVVWSSSLFAENGADVKALVDVNIVRPESNQVELNQTVIVVGSSITELGSSAQIEPPPDAQIIQAEGTWLMAGLTEMHAHVPRANEGEQFLRDMLFLWLANGVTSIRGMNGDPSHLDVRDRIASGDLLGPRLITAGLPFMGNRVKTPEQAEQLVNEHAAAGYDFLKVHMGLSRESYDAVVAGAQTHNMVFAGHVPGDVGLDRALEAGQLSIEHLDGYMPALVSDDADVSGVRDSLLGLPYTPFVDQAKFEVLAQATRNAGVWNSPTLSMAENFVRPLDPEKPAPGLIYMPRETVETWQQTAVGFQKTLAEDPQLGPQYLAYRKQLVKALHDAGAGLLLGSDATQVFNVPGFSIHEELRLFVEAGLTPAEALTTGTVNPAVYFGLEDRFGIIAVGLEADLVLVSENPLQNLNALRSPVGVMVRGRWMPSEEIEAGLADIKERRSSK